MSAKGPVEVVLAFIGRINAHDVSGLCELMTPHHRFVDALGAEVKGIENMRKAWSGYLAWFPDYLISHEEILQKGDLVAVFGTARGTYSVAGRLAKENHWEVPAAWRAVVRDGRIAEWQVYTDNQPARKIMG